MGLLAGLSLGFLAVLIGIPGGSAGEAGLEEPPQFNVLVVGPTGSFNTTDVFYDQQSGAASLTLYVANVGPGNLTLQIGASVAGDLRLETLDNTTVDLASYRESPVGYSAKVAWDLIPGESVIPPATFQVNISVEAIAWEGDVSPDEPIVNESWELQYLEARPGFEMLFPDGPIVMQTHPHKPAQEPLAVRLHNVGNLPLNVMFPLFRDGNEFEACSIKVGSANHVFMPPFRDYTWVNTVSVFCEVGTPPGEYQLEVAGNLSALEAWVDLSELEPVVAHLNLTLMPYSEQELLFVGKRPDVKVGEEYTIELRVTNFGNSRELIWVNMTPAQDSKEHVLIRSPEPVWLRPLENTTVRFIIRAPDPEKQGWIANSRIHFRAEGQHHHWAEHSVEGVLVKTRNTPLGLLSHELQNIAGLRFTHCLLFLLLLGSLATVVGTLNRFDPPKKK